MARNRLVGWKSAIIMYGFILIDRTLSVDTTLKRDDEKNSGNSLVLDIRNRYYVQPQHLQNKHVSLRGLTVMS